MKNHEQYCATCWQYSHSIGRCMITTVSERPDHVCEIGMYIAKPEPAENWKQDAREEEAWNG